MTTAAEHPGDPNHPDHEQWLLELGRANYAAARLGGVVFDILRVHGGHASADLYKDTLGQLAKKLTSITDAAVSGIAAFRTDLEAARDTRNDLAHALPVLYGLHRRRADDLDFVRNFFSVEAISDVTAELDRCHQKGSAVLHGDGGAALQAWYAKGGS
jgi:hypothetical protein